MLIAKIDRRVTSAATVRRLRAQRCRLMSGAELRMGALAALRRGQLTVLARGCCAPALREGGRLSHVAAGEELISGVKSLRCRGARTA